MNSITDKVAWKVRSLEKENILEVLAECGIKHLFLDWSSLKEFNSESSISIKDATQILKERDFNVDSFHAIHGAGFDLGETDLELRPKAIKLHESAIKIGAEWGVRTVDFHIAETFSIEARSAACSSIETLMQLAEKYNIIMTLLISLKTLKEA